MVQKWIRQAEEASVKEVEYDYKDVKTKEEAKDEEKPQLAVLNERSTKLLKSVEDKFRHLEALRTPGSAGSGGASSTGAEAGSSGNG